MDNGYCSWYNNGYCSWYNRLFIWRVPMTLIVSGSHNLISKKLEGKQEMMFVWFPPKARENGPCFFIGKQNMRGGKLDAPYEWLLRIFGFENRAVVKIRMFFGYSQIWTKHRPVTVVLWMGAMVVFLMLRNYWRVLEVQFGRLVYRSGSSKAARSYRATNEAGSHMKRFHRKFGLFTMFNRISLN